MLVLLEKKEGTDGKGGGGLCDAGREGTAPETPARPVSIPALDELPMPGHRHEGARSLGRQPLEDDHEAGKCSARGGEIKPDGLHGLTLTLTRCTELFPKPEISQGGSSGCAAPLSSVARQRS